YSDKKEKAALLPIGLLAAGIGYALLALPTDYYMVLFLVVISGLGVAAYHPEGYKTAHFFTGEQSVTGMAVFSVGGNLGLAIGPPMAIYVTRYLGFEALPVVIIPSLLCTALILAQRRTIAVPRLEHTDSQKQVKSASKASY